MIYIFQDEDLTSEIQATLQQLSLAAPEQVIAVASNLNKNKRKINNHLSRVTNAGNTLPAA